MNFSRVIREGIDTMGYNPASVDMQTKELFLNKDVLPFHAEFTRKFIIEHERGHLHYNTDDEKLADKYALHALYKTEKKSLKKSIKALCDFLDNDNDRIEALYNECLKLDKEMNNNVNINTLLKNRAFFRQNADGSDDADALGLGTPSERQSKRFVSIFGSVFTPFEVVMSIIAIIALYKYMK